ncbi:hypothetical protein TRFO_17546 [Tritrichomonas foetus]|uniref:Endoplasmic reticulum-Golgi intermediate compartment protein 3 n=1 Tax=Tritrichomonas foetus TaxID=1144522 RepID=A0A1J4KN22_9EUKA|nr:hypothetical protein TRFO_17546 [Tritrichomonas foetus]|eukprot:OHT12514.1 hypothetical protein TRFO_17546 [Tritrichomonas foetus]
MIDFLSSIDIYDKFSADEYRVRTIGGAILSLILSMFGSVLFFAQFIDFLIPDLSRDLTVNRTLTNNMELVNISLSLLVLFPCHFLKVGTSDSLGFSQTADNTITYRRISINNEFIDYVKQNNSDKCMPCYGARPEGKCCNSCEELVILHMMKNMTLNPDKWEQCKGVNINNISPYETCLLKGKLTVNKVPGSFHVAVGNTGSTRKTFTTKDFEEFPHFNLSHYISRLRFGPKLPTMSTPLENIKMLQNHDILFSYSYNLICTPVIFVRDNIVITKTFEYTMMMSHVPVTTENRKPPGIFFNYQFTPYSITVNWRTKSLSKFIGSTFGVLAGGFALTTLFDSFLFLFESKQKVIPEE